MAEDELWSDRLDWDASLAGWLAAPESAQRWWAAELIGQTEELSLGDEWLTGQMRQRMGVAVTIAAGHGGDWSAGEAEPLVARASAMDHELWDGFDQTRRPAGEAETDPPPWEELRSRDVLANEVAGDDDAGGGRGQTGAGGGMDGIWPLWERMPTGIASLAEDEAVWLAAEAGAVQEMQDEGLLVADRAAVSGGEQVVVVNVSGVDEAEIANIAVEQYEAAQARRRFRAHVPG